MLQTDFLSLGPRHTWFCDRIQTALREPRPACARQTFSEPLLPHTKPLPRRPATQQPTALFRGYYIICYPLPWHSCGC